MKYINAIFTDFALPLKCCICGKKINEGYYLKPVNDKTFNLMTEKLGTIENWQVGECCFQGFCGVNIRMNADDWFEQNVLKHCHLG